MNGNGSPGRLPKGRRPFLNSREELTRFLNCDTIKKDRIITFCFVFRGAGDHMKNYSWAKRIIAAALMLALSLSAAACAAPQEPEDTAVPRVTDRPGTGTVTGTDEVTDAPDPHADPGLPAVTFGGRSYTVFANSTVYGGDAGPRDIIYREENASETINEAVHDRNVYVEDKYDVSVEVFWTVENKLTADFSKGVAAGDYGFDVGECSMYYSGKLAVQGYLRDMANVSEYLDLTQDYWDQNCIRSLSLGHRVLAAAGDIMITDKSGIWAVCFNRDLIGSHNLDDPYDVVHTGEWTYDKMYEYSFAVGDALQHDPSDQFGITWGVLSERSNTYFMWEGCGVPLIVKDENDIPRLNELTEASYDTMLQVAKIQFDDNTILAHNVRGVDDIYTDGLYTMFQSGHALFYIGSLSMVEWMRAYDVDFGVLTMPKNSIEQKNYYSSPSNTRSWVFIMPNYTDAEQSYLDFVGIVTQALACESTNTLLEAYYDATLVYKGLRKEKDVEMLQLIFDSRVYELNHMFGWADPIVDQITAAKTAKMVARLKSLYDSYANSVTKTVEEYLSTLSK